MRNSYLRLRSDPGTGRFHPVLDGLEDAYRIINGVYRLDVKPQSDFPSPVTLIPSYPDLPMEHVYPRVPDPDTRELYLREMGASRIAYVPWDIDRTFWEIMNADHGRLLRQHRPLGAERGAGRASDRPGRSRRHRLAAEAVADGPPRQPDESR